MASGKVIVIGAGIGGLSAAHWLLQRGFDVEILEASDRGGGRMATLEHNGDKVDVGAQFYHSNYRYAFELMDAVGLSETKRTIKGKFRFTLEDGSDFLMDHRTPYVKPLGLAGNLTLYWFVLRHVFLGRRFTMYRIEKDIPEYDNVPILDYYGAPSDKAMRDFIVTPVSFGENMGMPEWLNLYHYIHQFRLSFLTDFVGLTGGVASLAEELARRLPVQYDSSVQQLVVEKGRVVGVQMANDGSIRKADHVVVTATPPAAARLMPEELDEQRQFFDSIVYSPMPMPVFFLDRPLRRDVWCYFLDPNMKRDFMMAIDETSKMPEMVPSGKSIVTGWSGHPMTVDLIDLPDEEIIEKAKSDMELILPGFSGYIEHAEVFRHPYGVARYPVGSYRKILDFKQSAERIEGVSFVGSVFGGTTMEAATATAAEAVDRVCRQGGMKE